MPAGPKEAPMLRLVPLVLMLASFAAPSWGQDDPARLRLQIAELRDELARAQQEILTLRAERDTLRSDLARANEALARYSASQDGSGAAPGEPEERRAAVPEDPYASIASLRAFLTQRYQTELAPRVVPILQVLDSGEATGQAAEDARAEIREEVDRWIRQVERTVRGRGEWVVDFLEVADTPSGDPAATIRLIDAASGLPIGDPISLELDRQVARRVLRHAETTRQSLPVRFRAFVVVKATPTYTERPSGPGIFGARDLVGDFVQFGYELDWGRMLPMERPAGERREQSPR